MGGVSTFTARRIAKFAVAPANPKAGDTYFDTVLAGEFICNTDGVWSAVGGGGGGITNSAGANVLTKSDGTNLVASGLTDDGTTISTPEKIATAATTGLVGVGMAPVAMLDVTVATSVIGLQVVASAAPASQPSGPGATAPAILALTGQTGGATSSTTANRTGGSGGQATITTGDGGAQTGASSGSARGGNGGQFAITTGVGGAATAVTGTVKGGAGGAFSATAGSGGTSATSTGGAGGSLTFQGGPGGVTTAAAASGKGSTLAFTAGSGGSNSNAAGTSGAGGDVMFSAGAFGIASGGAVAGSNGSVIISGELLTDNQSRVAADIPSANTTFINMTGISRTVLAAGNYVGELVVKCNNSTAAEGIKFDFNGGSATMTSFWAAANVLVGGSDVLGTGISTSLAGVMNFSTITGETVVIVKISFIVNVAGTVIPRFAENSTAIGTATVELGSFMILHKSN